MSKSSIVSWINDILATYIRRRGPLLAKGIAYSLLVGSMPFLFLSFSITSFLYKFAPHLQDAVSVQIDKFLPLQASEFLLEHIELAVREWASVGVIGIAILLFVAKGIFESMESGISAIMGIDQKRAIWRSQLYAFLFTLTAILFLIGASIGNTFFTAWLRTFSLHPMIYTTILKTFTIMILTFGIFTLYSIAAGGKLRPFISLFISLLVAILWRLAVIGGKIVIIQSGKRAIIYGILAGSVLFLFWLKIFAHLILFGGIIIQRSSFDEIEGHIVT